MEIYLQKEGKPFGPIPEEELRCRMEQGEVLPTDLAWRDGMTEWIPVSQLLQKKAIPPPIPISAKDRKRRIQADDFRYPKEIMSLYCCIAALCLVILAAAFIQTEFWDAFFLYTVFLVILIAGSAAAYVKYQESKLLAGAVRVSEKQFPEIHRCVVRAAENLSFGKPPTVFVKASPELNAFAMGFLGRPSVILHSALVEAMSEDELTAILGHEFSHIKCDHTFWVALTGGGGNIQVPVLSQILNFVFLFWSRKAEFTCDRGALIASRNLAGTISALAKMSTGKELFGKLDLDHFLEQLEELEQDKAARFSHVFSTHPPLVKRIALLREYAESPEYLRIVGG